MYSLSYARQTPRGSNFFEFDLAAFSLTREEIVGKAILDIGCNVGIFARHAQSLGARLTSLDPLFSRKSIREIANKTLEVHAPWFGIGSNFYPPLRRPVSALAQSLPFRDESFDLVVSYSAVPYYLPQEDYQQSITEILRVLKPGGQAHLAPFVSNDYPVGGGMFASYGYFEASLVETILQRLCVEYRIVEYCIEQIDVRDETLIIKKAK